MEKDTGVPGKAYIAGVLDFSSVDYPHDSASVVFFEGCDLRCRYCYNYKLLEFKKEKDIEQIEETLREHKKFVNAAVFTGGEPTLQPEALLELLSFAKKTGFKTKLDTNGNNPEVLKKTLPLLDYVAIDLKTSFKGYPRLAQKKVDPAKIKKSLRLIAGKEHEVRTTIINGINDTPGIVEEMATLLEKNGITRYVLQQFHAGMGTLDAKLGETEEPAREKLVELAKIAQKHVPDVRIRTRQAGEERVHAAPEKVPAGITEEKIPTTPEENQAAKKRAAAASAQKTHEGKDR